MTTNQPTTPSVQPARPEPPKVTPSLDLNSDLPTQPSSTKLTRLLCKVDHRSEFLPKSDDPSSTIDYGQKTLVVEINLIASSVLVNGMRNDQVHFSDATSSDTEIRASKRTGALSTTVTLNRLTGDIKIVADVERNVGWFTREWSGPCEIAPSRKF